MFIVGIYYSFDCEMPMYIFDTEEEAKEFIKEDFENEMRIAQEENLPERTGNLGNGFAQLWLNDHECSFIEWNIGTIKNR